MRDPHERGLRGPLVLPDPSDRSDRPAPRTSLNRRDAFDDLVSKLVDRLLVRWSTELAGIEFGTEDVPDLPVGWTGEPVPFATLVRPRPDVAGRIVVFRRPIEMRAPTKAEQVLLVHEVLVEHIGEYLGLDPDSIDP